MGGQLGGEILIGGGERFHDSRSGPPYSADAARLNRASGTAGRRGGAPRRLLGRCHVVDALGRVRRARQARDVADREPPRTSASRIRSFAASWRGRADTPPRPLAPTSPPTSPPPPPPAP